MPAIGPFEKVSFNNNAHIREGDDGSVVIATGTNTELGVEFVFGKDGTLSSGGVQFAKAGATTPVDPTDPTTPPGAPNVPAWTIAALQNGWTARSLSVSSLTAAPAFRLVGHRLELTGDLEAQGAASIVQAGESCVIFRLPVGARPLNSAKTLLVICGGNTVGTLKVFPDGQVVFLAGSMLGHVSLHGLSFPLD